MSVDLKQKKRAKPAVPVVVRLPANLIARLDKRAEGDFTSRSMVVRQLLVAGLKRGGEA